jgi:virginiamycin A acetyltransferase
VKNIVRKFARLFLKAFYPRLYFIEKNEVAVGQLATNIARSNISPKAKILGPGQMGNCEVGDYTYVQSNAVVSLTKIGKFCSIGPNFFCGFGVHPSNGLSTSPVFYSTNNPTGFSLATHDKIKENLPITIGNDVFIGMNVTVLDGVTIGDGAIIGAGAVVSKDIPPYAIAVGSPIKIIKYRFDEPTIAHLLKIKWWDFDIDKLKDVEKDFFDYQKFIQKHGVL